MRKKVHNCSHVVSMARGYRCLQNEVMQYSGKSILLWNRLLNRK